MRPVFPQKKPVSQLKRPISPQKRSMSPQIIPTSPQKRLMYTIKDLYTPKRNWVCGIPHIILYHTLFQSNLGSVWDTQNSHGSKPLTRSKISEISQWQKYFSELKISNPRISCTLNGVRTSSWKVVWVTNSSYDSETSLRWQIFCSCSWQAIDIC